jgi:hypothetical protein
MFGKQKRASSNDFLELYDILWQNGPVVKYQNPDGQIKNMIEPSSLP